MSEPSLDSADVITEVIRPAAIVQEAAARTILRHMSMINIFTDGLWVAEVRYWIRYDRPWLTRDDPGEAQRIGTLGIAHGTPTKYDVTIYQVMITQLGQDSGYTMQSLCDEALGFGGLTLDDCPRATLTAPPKPFRF